MSERLFPLYPVEFLVFVRTAQREEQSADHLFPSLKNESDSMLLVGVLSTLARDVPTEIIEDVRLERWTVLQKPDDVVRRIVVGDIVHRLVARTMTKQVSKQADK